MWWWLLIRWWLWPTLLASSMQNCHHNMKGADWNTIGLFLRCDFIYIPKLVLFWVYVAVAVFFASSNFCYSIIQKGIFDSICVYRFVCVCVFPLFFSSWLCFRHCLFAVIHILRDKFPFEFMSTLQILGFLCVVIVVVSPWMRSVFMDTAIRYARMYHFQHYIIYNLIWYIKKFPILTFLWIFGNSRTGAAERLFSHPYFQHLCVCVYVAKEKLHG